ncbi:hypothetical protein [Acidovorax sp.]|uniref:hypothetical protein n=1 Tax=Acidovorax sp. TaxID=1872122 RepID=UPI002ACD792C|nr:hypothetical protein [Acidovorax sp.]MDZ7865062.1 hypothetical protein [Acidovorax sp.]
MKILPAEFDGQRHPPCCTTVAPETWWFSVIDVVQVLTQQPDDLTATVKYRNASSSARLGQ